MIYLKLFLTFFKIGLFTIGGGYAMIPIISDTVVGNGWISSEMLIDFIAIAESTPGPFAVNIATFVGNQMGGILGGIAAVGGLFVPSFVIIFVIYKVSKKFLANKAIQDMFGALRPAVVGLISSALITIAYKTFVSFDGDTTQIGYYSIILSVIIFLAMQKWKKIHPIVFIVLSACIGILFNYLITIF